MQYISLIVFLAAFCAIDSWSIKDCANSKTVIEARDRCAKISMEHDKVERCIMTTIGVSDANDKNNLELAKNLINDYNASSEIKEAMQRDVGECGQVQHNDKKQMRCLYQVLTKNCLMKAELKKSG